MRYYSKQNTKKRLKKNSILYTVLYKNAPEYNTKKVKNFVITQLYNGTKTTNSIVVSKLKYCIQKNTILIYK